MAKKKKISKKQAENFITDIYWVYQKHGLSLSHEDPQGGFIIDKYSEYNFNWLKDAEIREEHN